MTQIETTEQLHILQGQHAVGSRPGQVMSTLLGSCVAACIRDPAIGLGGMNHFLLPGSDPGHAANVKYGAHAMEQLVNALLRAGAVRSRLQVSLFGGANVLNGMTKIGDANSVFARDFVRAEGFHLLQEDLGGCFGRKIHFEPVSGRVDLRLIKSPQSIPTGPVAPPRDAVGDIELF